MSNNLLLAERLVDTSAIAIKLHLDDTEFITLRRYLNCFDQEDPQLIEALKEHYIRSDEECSRQVRKNLEYNYLHICIQKPWLWNTLQRGWKFWSDQKEYPSYRLLARWNTWYPSVSREDKEWVLHRGWCMGLYQYQQHIEVWTETQLDRASDRAGTRKVSKRAESQQKSLVLMFMPLYFY